MRGINGCIFFMCLIILSGCTELTEYDDNAVVAIVRGEEITIGELRFLYFDENIMDNLDGTIKAKLAEQEVKKLNLELSEELLDTVDITSIYPSKDEDDEFAKGIREFAESQGAKLGMDPEEYYQKYFEKTQQISTYIAAYVEEVLGEPETMGETYSDLANELLDELVAENEDDIQILMK